MRFMMSAGAVWLSTALAVGSTGAVGQEPPPAPQQQVLSANPFGLLLELFNAEYERVVTESSTLGIGGSFAELEDEEEDTEETYFNADVFWRFYPQGTPLVGWAFGMKAGFTRGDLVPDAVSESSTYFGIGFDVNRSWIMGRNENFYVGVGFGLKRLLNADSNVALEIIPTFRIVNVGIAF